MLRAGNAGGYIYVCVCVYTTDSVKIPVRGSNTSRLGSNTRGNSIYQLSLKKRYRHITYYTYFGDVPNCTSTAFIMTSIIVHE